MNKTKKIRDEEFNGYKQVGELQINTREVEDKYNDKIKKESERLRRMLEEHPIG